MYDYFKIIEKIGEAHEEVEKLKERCKDLEDQLLKVQSTVIVYKDLLYEAKRVIEEDLDE